MRTKLVGNIVVAFLSLLSSHAYASSPTTCPIYIEQGDGSGPVARASITLGQDGKMQSLDIKWSAQAASQFSLVSGDFDLQEAQDLPEGHYLAKGIQSNDPDSVLIVASQRNRMEPFKLGLPIKEGRRKNLLRMRASCEITYKLDAPHMGAGR